MLYLILEERDVWIIGRGANIQYKPTVIRCRHHLKYMVCALEQDAAVNHILQGIKDRVGKLKKLAT